MLNRCSSKNKVIIILEDYFSQPYDNIFILQRKTRVRNNYFIMPTYYFLQSPNNMFMYTEKHRFNSFILSNIYAHGIVKKHFSTAPITDGFYLISEELMKCCFCNLILEVYDYNNFQNNVLVHTTMWSCKRQNDPRNIPLDRQGYLDCIKKIIMTSDPAILAFIDQNSNNIVPTIQRDKAMSNVYKFYTNRLNSFVVFKWPEIYSQYIEVLAERGFFYMGNSDILSCVCCFESVSLTKAQDHPCVSRL